MRKRIFALAVPVVLVVLGAIYPGIAKFKPTPIKIMASASI